MKRFLSVIMAIVIGLPLMFALASCSEKRHVYDYADRVVLSDNIHSMKLFPSCLETSVGLADAVAVVKVLNAGDEQSEKADPGSELVFWRTSYSLQVLETWYGNIDQDTIRLDIAGTKDTWCTKPYKNDRLIVFIDYIEDGGFYVLTDDEHSMFAINPPDDSLYAFSNISGLTAMDKKQSADLKAEIEKAVQAVCSDSDKWGKYAGAVCSERMDPPSSGTTE